MQGCYEIHLVFEEDVRNDLVDLTPDERRSGGAESTGQVSAEASFEVVTRRQIALQARHFPHGRVFVADYVFFCGRGGGGGEIRRQEEDGRSILDSGRRVSLA